MQGGNYMLEHNIIRKVVEAMQLKQGELVLLHFWGEDKDREILHNFSYEVARNGASPLELQNAREINLNLFEMAIQTCFQENYYKIFEPVDVVIDIYMYQPVVIDRERLRGKIELYKRYMRNLFESFKDKKKLIQIRIPSPETAIEVGMEEEVFLDKMLYAYDIDYISLRKDCVRKVEELKKFSKVEIKTGLDCKLLLSLEKRDWLIDAGEGDFPCGEVYIVPVENLTNGTVFFLKLFTDVNEVLENVTLRIDQGRIIGSDSELFDEFLSNLPDNGDIICELGFGMNSHVDELTGYTVLDEKKAGTFHLGIGNNTIFGGNNECIMHMDFVGEGDFKFS